MLLLGRKSTADANKASGREFVCESSERAQQYIDSLSRYRASDVENFQYVRFGLAEHAVSRRSRAGNNRSNKCRMHPVWNHGDSVRWNQPIENQRLLCHHTHANHSRGALKTSQDVPRHRAKRPRALFGWRFEQAAESVDVVA